MITLEKQIAMPYKEIIYKQDIVTISFDDNNFRVERIKDATIETCTMQYILPVLGLPYYTWLQGLWEGKTLGAEANPLAKELYEDYIVKALAYFVKYEMIIDLSYPMNNKGITVPSDNEGYHKAVSDQINTVKEQTFRKAQAYISRVYVFISDNITALNEEAGSDNQLDIADKSESMSGFIY